MSRILMTLLCCLALSSLLYFGPTARAEDGGRVIQVFDGDSMLVQVGRARFPVRLWGVDCPEKGQPYGREALVMARQLVEKMPIKLVPKDIDKHCRLVARVYTPKGDVGLAMLQAGLAWWYERYAPDETAYKQAQSQARRSKTGLWSDRKPIAPWLFRWR